MSNLLGVAGYDDLWHRGERAVSVNTRLGYGVLLRGGGGSPRNSQQPRGRTVHALRSRHIRRRAWAQGRTKWPHPTTAFSESLSSIQCHPSLRHSGSTGPCTGRGLSNRQGTQPPQTAASRPRAACLGAARSSRSQGSPPAAGAGPPQCGLARESAPPRPSQPAPRYSGMVPHGCCPPQQGHPHRPRNPRRQTGRRGNGGRGPQAPPSSSVSPGEPRRQRIPGTRRRQAGEVV